MLTNFLEEKLNELNTQASINSQANENTLASTTSSTTSSTGAKLTNGQHLSHQQAAEASKFDLAKRFPSRLWKNAIDYFSSAKSL